MRVASIDIGTNSVLLLIAEAVPALGLVAVEECSTITRLGRGVDSTGRLDAEAVERTVDCLRGYGERVQRGGVSRLRVVSTSAARDASGTEAFMRAAEGVLGVRPEVISGDEEARLTFLGALTGLDLEGAVAVYDIGGGSTEIVHGTVDAGAAVVTSGTSVNVGCVRMTERHIRHDPPGVEEVAAVRSDVEATLTGLSRPRGNFTLIGIGGTITTLAAVAMGLDRYEGARVHGTRLGVGEIERMVCELALMTQEEREGVRGLEPKRSDVIVAGAVMVQEVLRWADRDSTLVSDRGVRWGVALELSGPTM